MSTVLWSSFLLFAPAAHLTVFVCFFLLCLERQLCLVAQLCLCTLAVLHQVARNKLPVPASKRRVLSIPTQAPIFAVDTADLAWPECFVRASARGADGRLCQRQEAAPRPLKWAPYVDARRQSGTL